METFLNNLRDTLSEGAVDFLLTLLLGILVLAVGFRLIRRVMKWIKRSRFWQRIDETARSFLESLLSLGLKFLLIVITAGIVGVPAASIIAVLGSVGVAIGLAMQGSLSNLAGGFMLLLFKPFATGDYIAVSDEVQGTVLRISVFYTTLLAPDGCKVVAPNGAVSNGRITNYSATATRRLDIPFGVAYGSKPEQVREQLLAAVTGETRLLAEPAPVVLLEKMGASSLDFILRGYCAPEHFWDLKFSLTEKVHDTLMKNGLEIPFPQIDVHMKG